MIKQTAKKKARQSRPSADAKGREIVASLTELVETMAGGIPVNTRFTVRTVEAAPQPATYDAGAVRATRNALGISQALFASLLGVSAELVRSWEQGQRKPAPWARRLLDEINRDPQRWLRMLRRAS